MGRIWMIIGALAGAGAVAMAAAAAHALPARLDAKSLAAVQSAVQMQGWHAIALVLTGLWVMRAGNLAHLLGNIAGGGFAVGMVLFCGAIYGHHLGGIATGAVAPFGGVLLILAWRVLAGSAFVAGTP
jgi:uncharacterized membrane protein YgdD (TMEM256/DUF423 family)